MTSEKQDFPPDSSQNPPQSSLQDYPFVHLHNHSDFSLLDGAVKVDWYADRVVELGMDSIALTDHGNLFGAIHFEKACKDKGVKPIIGCEAYIAYGTRGSSDPDPRVPSRKRPYYHMVLYCKNETGYRNLLKLVSLSNTEGFYYKPRMDDELLAQYSEGLMASSACLGGEIPQLILADQLEEAQRRALFYQDLFGEGNFWLEVMRHGIPEEETVCQAIQQISQATGIPIIATNDVHYLRKEHAEAHDVLTCVGTKKPAKDKERKRMKLDMPEFYLKTPKEMYELFADLPEALANTVKLAEKCNLEIPKLKEPILPEYQIPEGYKDQDSYFCDLVWQFAKERYGDPLSTEVHERVEYELETICKVGYVGYFLVVWDFIHWAKEQGISVGPGRGSGAGSIIAYVLGITNVEPLQYNLLFERFLNPERVSMPDFDIDFCFERRGEVIDYVTQKYGQENVAGICTFGTFKAKAVLKDVARVLDIPFEESNSITSLVPDDAKDLAEALEKEPQLQELREKGERYEKLFEISAILEGMSRHVSTHACGIVIGREPISNYVPLHKDNKNDTLSSQYTMDLIEACGLVKMDFLGLKTLTLLDKIENLVRKRIPDFSFDEIPEDDAATFAMLSRGESGAVFQFESEGMQKVLKDARPSSIEDLIALNALYRPGPMQYISQFVEHKKNPSRIQYAHKDLRQTLEPTYGVIVYQEQVMEVARIIGGFSLGKADEMRRAMGKKKQKEMNDLKKEFVEGAIEKGYAKTLAEGIYEMLIPFAGYGFNKSHAAAYSILAYKTAYSRANFPSEFMAANLTNEIGNPVAFRRYISDLENMHITWLAPDINDSEQHFTVDNGTIIFGLQGIKNVGAAIVEEIIADRAEHGPFRNFLDFMERMKMNRKTLEALINAGAFRRVEREHNQGTLLANVDKVCVAFSKNQDEATANLFGDCSEEIAVQFEFSECEDLSEDEKLEKEAELLGVYVSGHPLDRYRKQRQRCSTLRFDQVDSLRANETHTVIAMLKNQRKITTKRDSKVMISLELSDFYGSIKAVIFPKALAKSLDSGVSYLEFLEKHTCVALRGKLEKKMGQDPQLIVEEIWPPEDAPLKPKAELHVYLNIKKVADKEQVEGFRSLLYDYSGSSPIFFHVRGAQGGEYVLEAGHAIGVKSSRDLESKLLDNDLLELEAVEFA